jgi:hypothetical protein
MRPFLVLRALALLAVVLQPLAAQEHPNVAKGFSPSGSFGAAGVDSVNLFNGNLVLTIPLGQRFPVSSGLAYGLTLVYNSQIWESQVSDPYVQSFPNRMNNAGLGWMVSLGRINPPEYHDDFEVVRDTYQSPDGARHTLYPTLHEGETQTAGVEYSRDGSYLRYKTTTRTLEFPDGTKHTFDVDGYPTQISDPFGNAVTITYLSASGQIVDAPSAMVWSISDGNRTHKVYFKPLAGPSYQTTAVDRVDLAAFNGQRAVYTFNYNVDDGLLVVLRGCSNTDPNTSSMAVALLTRLTLPDGSSYAMPSSDYFGNTFDTCRNGMIHRLTLPTLGKIEWDYITYLYPVESSRRPFIPVSYTH